MSLFLEAGIKVVVAFVFLLLTTLILIWAERKWVSDLQNRIWTDRA
jgi:NADH:ubiquinone oxidoreductase subunit H